MTISGRILSIINIPGDNDFIGLSCFLDVGLSLIQAVHSYQLLSLQEKDYSKE